jgi:hypothetical protein
MTTPRLNRAIISKALSTFVEKKRPLKLGPLSDIKLDSILVTYLGSMLRIHTTYFGEFYRFSEKKEIIFSKTIDIINLHISNSCM